MTKTNHADAGIVHVLTQMQVTQPTDLDTIT